MADRKSPLQDKQTFAKPQQPGKGEAAAEDKLKHMGESETVAQPDTQERQATSGDGGKS